MRRLLTMCLLALSTTVAWAQDYQITAEDYGNTAVPMADAWHANGKIFVVVAVVMVVFAGLVAYMVATDRRLRKLEKAQRASANEE